MENSDKTLEEKQQYLREQIIEQGFDGTDFFSFIKLELHLESDDIDVSDISFDRLVRIVNDFKAIEATHNTTTTESSADYQITSLTDLKPDLPSTSLCTENLNITVSDPKKQTNGFFGSSFFTFKITTNPCNFNVRRRFSEIGWLRLKLTVLFPGSIVKH